MIKKPQVKVTQDTQWQRAVNAARRTIGREPIDHNPSQTWEVQSLIAEHSHIKLVEYTISVKDLAQWVGVHLVRHPFMLPFIHSQRDDRDTARIKDATEKIIEFLKEDIKNDEEFNPRDYRFQGEPNDQDFVVNAQTLINISRKRLCMCASKETREVWQMVREAIREIDPMMAHAMVRNCVYRCRCPEMRTDCNYDQTKAHDKEVEEYWSLSWKETQRRKEQ